MFLQKSGGNFYKLDVNNYQMYFSTIANYKVLENDKFERLE